MLHVILNLTCLLNLKTKLQSLDRKYPLHQSINSLNAVLFTNVYVFGKSSIISLLICSVGRMTCDRKGFVFEKYIFSLDFSKFDIILKFSWSVSQMFFFRAAGYYPRTLRLGGANQIEWPRALFCNIHYICFSTYPIKLRRSDFKGWKNLNWFLCHSEVFFVQIREYFGSY